MSDAKEPEEEKREFKDDLEDAGEKVKEGAKGFWKFLRREGVRGKRKLDKAVAISRIQGRIGQLQGEREKLFVEMGTKVYALFQNQRVKNPDLLALCEQVGRLYAEQEEVKAEVEKIKAEQELPAEPEPAAEEPPAEAPPSDEPLEVEEPAPEEPAPEEPAPEEPTTETPSPPPEPTEEEKPEKQE